MCFPSRLGTIRQKKETGIVATKQRRKRRTATDTPIEAAIESMSIDIMVAGLKLGSNSLGLSHTTESLRGGLFQDRVVDLPFFVRSLNTKRKDQFFSLHVINRSVYFLNTRLNPDRFGSVYSYPRLDQFFDVSPYLVIHLTKCFYCIICSFF